MAKVSEIGGVLKQFGSVRVLKRLFQQVSEDNLTTLAAAMAYTWLFALFPFLVFLLGLVPLTPERYKPVIVKQVGQAMENVLTPDAAGPLKEQVNALLNKTPTGGLLSVGLLFTLYGASKGMSTTMMAIDRCYDVKKHRAWWIQYSLPIVLTVVVTIMILLVMILLPIGTGVLYWIKHHWIHDQALLSTPLLLLINVVRYVVALALLAMILGIIYHFGPTERPSFVWVTPGAIFSIVVWLLLGWGLQIYMTRFHGAESYQKVYGGVAGAAVVLLIFYFDALVMLVGAEINSEIDLWVREAEGKPNPEPSAIADEMKSKGEPVTTDPKTSA